MKIFNDKKIILYIVCLLIIFSCESNNNEETKTSVNNEDINLLSKSNLLNENTNIESNIFWISGKGTVKQDQEIIEINISIEHRDKDIINASKDTNGLLMISAGNYEGRLGKSFIYLNPDKQPK